MSLKPNFNQILGQSTEDGMNRQNQMVAASQTGAFSLQDFKKVIAPAQERARLGKHVHGEQTLRDHEKTTGAILASCIPEVAMAQQQYQEGRESQRQRQAAMGHHQDGPKPQNRNDAGAFPKFKPGS